MCVFVCVRECVRECCDKSYNTLTNLRLRRRDRFIGNSWRRWSSGSSLLTFGSCSRRWSRLRGGDTATASCCYSSWWLILSGGLNTIKAFNRCKLGTHIGKRVSKSENWTVKYVPWILRYSVICPAFAAAYRDQIISGGINTRHVCRHTFKVTYFFTDWWKAIQEFCCVHNKLVDQYECAPVF